MASQGPNSVGTGANDAAVGSIAWTDPSSIIGNGVDYCYFFSSSDVTSNYIKATGFGFSIPSGATIDGIVVEIRKSRADSCTVIDNIVKLVKGGTILGDNKASASDWDTGYAWQTYGTPSALWGTTWTDTDINAADFGVVLSCSMSSLGKSSRSAGVLHAKITVYYTTGGGGGGSTTNAILYIGN